MRENSEDALGRQCGTGGDQEFETEDLVFLVPAETKLGRLWQKSLLNDDDVMLLLLMAIICIYWF